eukprot:TRINITY_DN943_c0_g1_i1.p1 TRINITY_DN943_c0_g1~~TRINITY_DN943_c0_g1_i1.p1  ORF type:complete len:484 (+),score=92.65 TRINITY_DN943_c0_g1_i1:37-1488(+)
MFDYFILVIIEVIRCVYSAKYYISVDIPCYQFFAQRFQSKIVDYDDYICDYGYMYYGPIFVYLYDILTRFFPTEISLLHFQMIFYCLNSLLIYKCFKKYFKSPYVLFVFNIICQTSYRGSVSNGSNDIYVSFLQLVSLMFIMRGFDIIGVFFCCCSVLFKMNSVSFLLGVGLYYFCRLIFKRLKISEALTIISFNLLMVFMICRPFIDTAGGFRTFIQIFFNLSRDFVPRDNFQWGFLGDLLRLNSTFYQVLMLAFATINLIFVFGVFKTIKTRKYLFDIRQIESQKFWAFVILFPSFVIYATSRGIHTQFFTWIYWFLPFFFEYGCGLNFFSNILLFRLFDWTHSWKNSGIFLDKFALAIKFLVSLNFSNCMEYFNQSFGKLVHLGEKDLEPNSSSIQYLGFWYNQEDMNPFFVSLSLVLFCIEVFIILSCLIRLYRGFIGVQKEMENVDQESDDDCVMEYKNNEEIIIEEQAEKIKEDEPL